MNAEEASTTEAHMRHVLGLGGVTPAQPVQRRLEPARTRSRFVRDGDVPVVVLNSSRVAHVSPNGRVEAIQATLVTEQTARITAERSLVEALATVRSLQTKLAHAELAHREALAAEREARERAEATLQEMVAARQSTERRLGAAAIGEVIEASTPRARIKRAAPAKAKIAAARTCEPKPVKWWLPSYKAAKQGR